MQEYDFGKTTSGVIFGAITGITGLFGSALGGVILDWIKPKGNAAPIDMIIAAHKVMLACSIVAAPAAVAGFLLKSRYPFLACLFIGELAAFMMIGPINSSIVWYVIRI